MTAAVGAGVGAAAVLVLLIGNEASQRILRGADPAPGVDGDAPAPGTAWAVIVNALRFLSFDFSTGGAALTAWLLGVLIYLLALGLILAIGMPGLRAASGFGGIVFVWGAVMLAAAIGGGLAALLGYDLNPDSPAAGRAMATAFAGTAYGLVVGWIIAIVTVALSRSGGGGGRGNRS